MLTSFIKILHIYEKPNPNSSECSFYSNYRINVKKNVLCVKKSSYLNLLHNHDDPSSLGLEGLLLAKTSKPCFSIFADFSSDTHFWAAALFFVHILPRPSQLSLRTSQLPLKPPQQPLRPT